MIEYEKGAERKRVEFLAQDYIRPRPENRRRGRHHPFDDGFYVLHESLERLRRANEILEFLKVTGRDPYETFGDAVVDGVLDDARYGLESAKQVLNDSGILGLLDEHFDTVMLGLDPDGLPDEEAAVLEMLGFPGLAAAIWPHTDLLAAEWRSGSASGVSVAREFRQRPASSAIDTALDRIKQHREDRKVHTGAVEEPSSGRPSSEPKKQRRWWKGLGQIVQGAAISVADVGMAAGAFNFPVSAETRTYGAVMSVTAGVGTIMNGVGDLWGE